MNKIKIASDLDFLLEIDGQNFELSPHNSVILQNVESDIYIKAYPIEGNFFASGISFAFKLYKTSHGIKTNRENVSIFKLKDYYKIVIFPFLVFENAEGKTQKITIGGTPYTVRTTNSNIFIENTLQNNNLPINIKNATVSHTQNAILISGEHNNKTALVVYLILKNKFFCFNGEQIELTTNGFNVLSHIQGIAKHIELCNYEIGPDSIDIANRELFYKNKTPKLVALRELVPYAFFESLQAKDYTLAKSYMTDSLSSIMTNDTLDSFFGNFENIEITNFSPLQYSLFTKSQARTFNISLSQNKISDISEE